MWKKIITLTIGALLLQSAAWAQNDFSVGLRGGLVNYSTAVKGESISFGSGFDYDATYTAQNIAAGPYLRYLHQFGPRALAGIDVSYSYLNVDKTGLRADETDSTPVDEVFTTKSNSLIELDALVGFNLTQDVRFIAFGGPAWLSTEYIDNDITDGVSESAAKKHQLTANLGMEVEWLVTHQFSLGLRTDYVFKTSDRTVATTDDNGNPLTNPTVANSSLMLVELTAGYHF